MCTHEWKKINDVQVCARCGLTRTYDGKVFFDKKVVNYTSKKRNKKKR